MCICESRWPLVFVHAVLTSSSRCIFLIDPSMTRSAVRGHAKAVSETTISHSWAVNQPDDYPGDVMMSSAELRVIGRLSARVNVLPVIAKADSLTDESLAIVKAAVHKGLQQAGLDFGVLSGPKPKEELHSQSPSHEEHGDDLQNGVNGNGNGTAHHVENGHSRAATGADAEQERGSRTVIRLK